MKWKFKLLTKRNRKYLMKWNDKFSNCDQHFWMGNTCLYCGIVIKFKNKIEPSNIMVNDLAIAYIQAEINSTLRMRYKNGK